MEEQRMIKRMIAVFDGAFIPGYIKTSKPRFSDALVFYVEGEADYIFSDYALSIKEGDVFYLEKGSRYSIDVKKNTRFICINFEFEASKSESKSCSFKNMPTSVKSEFFKLLHIWLGNRSYKIPRSLSLLYGIYYECLASQSRPYVKDSGQWKRLITYILEHYSDPNLSIKDIAEATDMSEAGVRRIFKIKRNTTPVKYLNTLRMEKAKNLLETSNLTVADISAATGFTDPFYFSRIFKKHYGLSPDHYRKTRIGQ